MTTTQPAVDPKAQRHIDPAQDTPTSLGGATVDEIERMFTAARAAEGLNVPLKLPPGFMALPPKQQALVLMNLERSARQIVHNDGTTAPFAALAEEPVLIGRIAQNHALEESTYKFFDHSSPINRSSTDDSTAGRMAASDPLVVKNGGAPYLGPHGERFTKAGGEIISVGSTYAAGAVYGWMYVDKSQKWGHRHAILGEGKRWAGIGWAPATTVNGSKSPAHWVVDFAGTDFDPRTIVAANVPTTPPLMNRPTLVGGVPQVSGVRDTAPRAGADSGPVVTFYVGRVTKDAPSGWGNFADVNDYSAFSVVRGVETSPGVFVPDTRDPNYAQLMADVGNPAKGPLHAVAVDRAGNFTDLPLGAQAQPVGAGLNAPTQTITQDQLVSAVPAGYEPAPDQSGIDTSKVKRYWKKGGVAATVLVAVAAAVVGGTVLLGGGTGSAGGASGTGATVGTVAGTTITAGPGVTAPAGGRSGPATLTVTGADGRPLAGAAVALSSQNGNILLLPDGSNTANDTATVTTGPDGRATFSVLARAGAVPGPFPVVATVGSGAAARQVTLVVTVTAAGAGTPGQAGPVGVPGQAGAVGVPGGAGGTGTGGTGTGGTGTGGTGAGGTGAGGAGAAGAGGTGGAGAGAAGGGDDTSGAVGGDADDTGDATGPGTSGGDAGAPGASSGDAGSSAG